MELLSESYQRFFDLPFGRVGAMADIYVDGDLIEFHEFILYPIGREELVLGVRLLLAVRREVEADIRKMGFTRLRITGHRTSGASPGRIVLLEERL